MHTPDRQMKANLGGIRLDHIRRYLHALPMVKSPVLDAACGCGYGAHIMAEAGHIVTAVDIEREATDWGQRYYPHGNIQWITGDITENPWNEEKFNSIVCFETLEHLKKPNAVLVFFRRSLNPGGKLFISVPNEEQYPFDPRVFAGDQYPHQRHYTPAELEETLNKWGFEVIHRGTQMDKTAHVVTGSNGKFLVYTAIGKSNG